MRYPLAVLFMLGNEFCERFSYYGMRAVLTNYLITEHHLQDHITTFIYHTFVCIAYLSALPGSVLADSYLGRYRVILYVSIFYVFGHVLLSGGALPYLGIALRSVFDFSGLLVIALGTGGIKPCVSAFAADQFDESQAAQRAQFFSYFYFAINGGSLLAAVITPLLRRVQCLGSQQCFPLAFGVPGVLMLVALIVFISGTRFYKKTPQTSRLICDVVGCIGTALRRKKESLSKKETTEKEHWLDHAAPDYSLEFIDGVKSKSGTSTPFFAALTAIALLFAPLVFFSALFDQKVMEEGSCESLQGSTWIQLMRRLDGRVGPMAIFSDQLNFLNPLLVLILVPLFEFIVYPCIGKIVRVTQLRKMALGGLFVAASFVLAGIVQLQAAKSQEPKPQPGFVFVQSLGNFGGPLELAGPTGDSRTVLNSSRIEIPTGEYEAFVNGERRSTQNFSRPETLDAKVGQGYGLVFFDPSGSKMSVFNWTTDKIEGTTRIILAIEPESKLEGRPLFVLNNEDEPPFISNVQHRIKWGTNCSEKWQDCEFERVFEVTFGATHALILSDSASDMIQLVRENSVNMLWVIPQYVVITTGEVLLSVTALEFSYSQAAPNMKSILQAMWLMTTFLGNVIDMIISGSHIVPDPAMEFFVYAALMAIVMGVFILLAMRYTYVKDRQITMPEALAEKRGIAIADTDL